MTSPTISIIIPVYNVESYLRECLDSVLSQTYKDWECILVDDGSKDSSGAICDEYAEKDNRFKAFHQTNQGQASARNLALNNAMGDYIMFLDSDDYWISQTVLTELLNLLDLHPDAQYIQFSYFSFFEDKPFPSYNKEARLTVLPDQRSIINAFEHGQITTITCDKIFHRSAIGDRIRFPYGVYYEDERFIIDLIEHLDQVVISSKDYYAYRIRSGSTTHGVFDLRHACDLFEKDFHGTKVTKALPEAESLYMSYSASTIREYCNVILMGGEERIKQYTKDITRLMPSFAQLWKARKNIDNSTLFISGLIKILGFKTLIMILNLKSKR